jgi:hypothetical protein
MFIEAIEEGEGVTQSLRSSGNALWISEEWNYTVVDLSTDSTVVTASPALIGNIWGNTVLSAHACPVMDGATSLFSLPASSAVGTVFSHLKGTRVASLTIDPDNAATGAIVVQWRPR